MTSNISDQTILQLWRSPEFSGSYRGIATFKRILKTDLDIDVSESRLYNVLKKDPVYLIHLKPNRKFERRHSRKFHSKHQKFKIFSKEIGSWVGF